jgi:hypothetical protein
MSQNPVESIAGAGEGIDGRDGHARWQRCCNSRDVAADAVGQNVSRAFHSRATEQAYTERIPVSGPQAIEAEVVRVVETVDAVLSDLYKRQHLDALGAVQ